MTVDITYDEMNILNLNGLSLESVQGDIAMKRAGGMSDDDIRADYTSLINELKPLTTTSANDTAKIQNWQNKGAITPFEYGQRNSIQYDNIKGKEAPIDTATRTLGEVSKQAESYLYNFDAALGTVNRLIGGIARNRVLHEKDLENSETSDKKIGFAEAFRNTFKSGEWLPFVGGFLSKNGFDAKREREIEKKIRNGEALYESDLDFINYRINKRQEENVRGVSVGGHIAEDNIFMRSCSCSCSSSCTKRDFALMLQELGVTYTQLKTLIASSEQAQLEWDLCERLYRFNPLLDVMASQLGITSEQLDTIFKTANGENSGEQGS